MNCECYKRINEKLKAQNLKLCGYTLIVPDFKMTPTVSTCWINEANVPKGMKNKPTSMLASYCPFCGVPVDPNKDNSRPG